MATNKPTGDNARKGAVKKRSQTKTTICGKTTWTKRDTSYGEFIATKTCEESRAEEGRSGEKEGRSEKDCREVVQRRPAREGIAMSIKKT
jgi:hypothetical protein